MNSSRWMFTSMISKCHSISITIHRSTLIDLFSDRQAHKRIRTTLVHTGTLTNLTSWSNQQHLSTADIAPSMQGIMKGVPVDWFWSLSGCMFDRRIISNWKELIRNQTMSLKTRYKLKPIWVLNFTQLGITKCSGERIGALRFLSSDDVTFFFFFFFFGLKPSGLSPRGGVRTRY